MKEVVYTCNICGTKLVDSGTHIFNSSYYLEECDNDLKQLRHITFHYNGCSPKKPEEATIHICSSCRNEVHKGSYK